MCIAFEANAKAVIGITGTFGELSDRAKLVAILASADAENKALRAITGYPRSALVLSDARFCPSLEMAHLRVGRLTRDSVPGMVLFDESGSLHLVVGHRSSNLAVSLRTGEMSYSDHVGVIAWSSAWRIAREELGAHVDVVKFAADL